MIVSTREQHEAYCKKGPLFAEFARFALKEGYARIAEEKDEEST
jgi:hypothetical protein